VLKCSMCYQSGMHPYLYPELVERKSRYTDMQDRNRTESLTWLMDMVMGLGIHSGLCWSLLWLLPLYLGTRYGGVSEPDNLSIAVSYCYG